MSASSHSRWRSRCWQWGSGRPSVVVRRRWCPRSRCCSSCGWRRASTGSSVIAGSLPSRSSRSSRSASTPAPRPPTRWSSPPTGCSRRPVSSATQWTRAFVSDGLAWWHAVWLLGLALLWLAVALPRPARRFLHRPGSDARRARRGRPVRGAAMRAIHRHLAAALLLPSLAACAPAAYDNDGETLVGGRLAPAPAKAPDRVPVVIDSDLAPDDLAAIAYLVRHPSVEVLGDHGAGHGHGDLQRGRRPARRLLRKPSSRPGPRRLRGDAARRAQPCRSRRPGPARSLTSSGRGPLPRRGAPAGGGAPTPRRTCPGSPTASTACTSWPWGR